MPPLSIKHKYLPHHNCLIVFLTLILRCHTLRLTQPPSMQPSPLGVFMERSPESIVAPQGDEVLFECKLNLDPERLEWRFRPFNKNFGINEYTYLRKNESRNLDFNISNEGGTSELRINVSQNTLGEYQCVAWYGASALASIPARLTLAAISLADDQNSMLSYAKATQPEQILRWRVSPQNSILVKCGEVISTPPAVWSFFKENIPLPQSEPQLPSGSLVLQNLSPSDSGTYSCSAVNAITGTNIRLPTKVHLSVEHTPRSSPQFLWQPSNYFAARPGQIVILECPGVGNPQPKAVWSRPDANITNNRTSVLEYGLQIVDVNPHDQGIYVCRLDNGINPVLVQTIKLDVIEPPVILKGPPATLTNESDSLELECSATGSKPLIIYWMINGKDTRDDPLMQHKESKLIVKNVEKRHAGIVQCFAKNDVGEANQSNLLQVNPKQIPGEIGKPPIGNSFSTKSPYDHSGKQNKGRKKHKTVNMIPPSRPNVTRLSDDSVMIRWNVPNNDGLPIQFFKVQYRMLGNAQKTIPRENWQTTNDDIPYGKRDKNNNGVKNFTSAVTGLKPDRLYRFRILAVYSNNDNKEGNSSGKFYLQRAISLGPSRSHLSRPNLTTVEAYSETEIVLRWSFPQEHSNLIEGFYAYYRPASTAGEYSKATVDSGFNRHFKIDMLEPGTAYEFKLQSFTASTASDFSEILTGKTLKPPSPPTVITPSVVPAKTISEDSNSLYPVIAGGAGGLLLLVAAAVIACLYFKKVKKTQRDDEVSKQQLDNHIQAESPPNYIHSHNKSSHRAANGMPKMTITPNPFEEGDKNRNVMELRFMPTGTPTTVTNGGGTTPVTTSTPTTPNGLPTATQLQSVGLPLAPHHHHSQKSGTAFHHQHTPYMNSGASPSSTGGVREVPTTPTMNHKMKNNHQQNHSSAIPQYQHGHLINHHYQPSSPLTPSMDRRTLDRSARNLHYQHSSDRLDSADGIPSTKIPSLRRTRRTSGSANNNNGGVGSGSLTIQGSPRVQRSPMPNRATAMKRNRLGSHTNDNISSGSLNSIEV